jgi:tubulin polyglutamylase TTLL5
VDEDRDDFGNKWSLTALRRKLRELGYDVGLINMRIEDIIIKTILSIEDKLFKAVE